MTALPVDARRIGECVSFHAAREPGREAAVHGATRLAYRDLDRIVARWARALLAAGVARGDRVASLTPPSTEWLAVMLGTTEIVAIWTGYHPRYRMPEFRHVTELAEPAGARGTGRLRTCRTGRWPAPLNHEGIARPRRRKFSRASACRSMP